MRSKKNDKEFLAASRIETIESGTMLVTQLDNNPQRIQQLLTHEKEDLGRQPWALGILESVIR